jgi:hypothetical protein
MQFGRQFVKASVIAVAVLAVLYSAYTLYGKQKEKYRQEGYASALSQLVEASKDTREVNVTVGDKTVKFVVVSPANTPETPAP